MVQIIGSGATIAEVEAASKALRITPRPIDVVSLGSYGISLATGTMAAALAAAAPVFSFRWGDADNLALIRKIAITMVSLGTGFTAGIGLFELMMARSFSASDSGGAAATLTGNNAKKRTSFGSSLVTDMRISTTTTLTAGTRTLDSAAMAAIRLGIPTSTNALLLATKDLWYAKPDEWPLVLAQNEGFIIRATVPATGTWQLDVQVWWDELESYQ